MIGKPPGRWWAAVPATLCLLLALVATSPRRASASAGRRDMSLFGEARAVVNRRCLPCHSQYPTDDLFKVAPNGVMFDTPEEVLRLADRIRERAVVQKTMPLANKTGLTEEERATLGRWLGASGSSQSSVP